MSDEKARDDIFLDNSWQKYLAREWGGVDPCDALHPHRVVSEMVRAMESDPNGKHFVVSIPRREGMSLGSRFRFWGHPDHDDLRGFASPEEPE